MYDEKSLLQVKQALLANQSENFLTYIQIYSQLYIYSIHPMINNIITGTRILTFE